MPLAGTQLKYASAPCDMPTSNFRSDGIDEGAQGGPPTPLLGIANAEPSPRRTPLIEQHDKLFLAAQFGDRSLDGEPVPALFETAPSAASLLSTIAATLEVCATDRGLAR